MSGDNGEDAKQTPMATMVQDEEGNYSPAAQPYRPANPAYGPSHPAYPVSDGLMAEEAPASTNSWVLSLLSPFTSRPVLRGDVSGTTTA